MHIQACTLIYNLARKGENAKQVAWNEFQQPCTLSSLPPPSCLCAQLMLSGGQEELESQLPFFSRKTPLGWKSHHKGRALHHLVCQKAGAGVSEQGTAQLCSGHH